MRTMIGAIGPMALGVALVFAVAGCSESQAERESRTVIKDSMEETALKEVGSLYQACIDQNSRPPKSVKDFSKDAAALPFGYDWLSRGDLVAFWGATLSDAGSGAVLAYEKKAPEKGGYVLMQDGKTVKTMTADEFKAAPKAGEGAPATKQ